MKNILTKPLLALVALAALGGGAGIAALASAQTTNQTAAVTTSTDTSVAAASTATPAADPADAAGAARPQGHMPLGKDGNVVAVSGTTITMQEESDEGGASYTIDASQAKVTKDGAASSLSSLAVGDKIFVEGSVNGTSVSATQVSLGHPGGPRGN